MIKSFRGLLADGGQETIRLSTIRGEIGYKIKKFQIMANTPGAADYEAVVKLWSYEQDAIDGVVDFNNSELLGAAYLAIDNSSPNPSAPDNVIFDNVAFNQDIFVTYKAITGSASCNYYIELEQIKLNLNEATVATLKDMRGSN
jgi:hypothetical protein